MNYDICIFSIVACHRLEILNIEFYLENVTFLILCWLQTRRGRNLLHLASRECSITMETLQDLLEMLRDAGKLPILLDQADHYVGKQRFFFIPSDASYQDDGHFVSVKRFYLSLFNQMRQDQSIPFDLAHYDSVIKIRLQDVAKHMSASHKVSSPPPVALEYSYTERSYCISCGDYSHPQHHLHLI